MIRTIHTHASAMRWTTHTARAASSFHAPASVSASASPSSSRFFSSCVPRAASHAPPSPSTLGRPGPFPFDPRRPPKQAPRLVLPLPDHVPLSVGGGEVGMDAAGHWHEKTPKLPTFKEALAQETYNNAEIRGSGYQKPKHANSPLAIHGIGVPSVRQSMPPPPRRTLKPRSVQDVPHPMKTYTTGPRELGHKIVRTFLGHVTSDKMQKTVAVEVSQYYRHPKYHKYIKTSKKFLAHDEDEECNVGDVVEIRVCRPMSKRKHFTLHRIIKPKLDIEDAAKIHAAALPEWNRGPDYKSFDQLALEDQQEHEQFEAAQAEADEEAAAAMAASEQRPNKH